MARAVTKLGESQVDDTLASHLAQFKFDYFNTKHHSYGATLKYMYIYIKAKETPSNDRAGIRISFD